MLRSGLTGALVGALLTAALVAVLYLAHQLVGLPFAPFDVFDWLGRVLPGAMVTFGIDAIVAALRAFGAGELSAAAKTAEQVLAIAGLLVTGTVLAALLFGALHGTSLRRPLAWGLVAGALLGLPVLAISLSRGGGDTPPAVSAAWTLAAFLAWGATLGWSFRRLYPAAARQGAGADAAAEEPGAGAAGDAAPSGEVRPTVEPFDRRRFLVRLGGATAAITVIGAGVGAVVGSGRRSPREAAGGEPWSARNPLPNAGAEVEPVRGTRQELTPVENHYRIDINTRPPVVEEADWRLRVDGLVEQPAELTLSELRDQYPPMHQFITLACISNPIAGDLISTTRWTGVSLRDLLGDVRPGPSATHLKVRSVDDFHETVALDDIRADPRIMLAYAWDGLPLPTEHGFPIRIYIPDRYGMKQPKWIQAIEAIDGFDPGYWVERGWDREARMNATSVIDTVASNMMISEAGTEAGGTGASTLIPIGGMAHAGARGVSKVEVRVDEGPWREARTREPLSDLTWVLWRYEWPFEDGEHTFAVRCYDGEGRIQEMERTPVRPDGATGVHTRNVML